MEAYYDHLATRVDDMNTKLDQLVLAANMGKGAWWLLLRIGGLMVLLVGAAAWAFDHWPRGRG